MATSVFAELDIPLKAGETNSLFSYLKVYIGSIRTTNLQHVILYEYDTAGKLKQTTRAEYGDVDRSQPDILIMNLHNVTLTQAIPDGTERTAIARRRSVRIDMSQIKHEPNL